jgi:hypothetical protein
MEASEGQRSRGLSVWFAGALLLFGGLLIIAFHQYWSNVANQSPMTRANARVRACDSWVAGTEMSLRW